MDYHQKFHQTHVVCPVCQNNLEHENNRTNCTNCGFEEYNNPAPCVSLTILKNNQVLLCKRAIEPAKGTWDVIGGFIDAGETAEEAAVREMKEETGLDTEVEKNLGSTWDIYDGRPTLAMMFVMKPLNNQEPKANDDVEELQWFDFDQPPTNLAFRNVGITIEKAKAYALGKANNE